MPARPAGTRHESQTREHPERVLAPRIPEPSATAARVPAVSGADGGELLDLSASLRILSLGEAKLGEVMGRNHVRRLVRARDLLAARGYDTSRTVLACYSGAGFSPELREGTPGEAVKLIGTNDLYADLAAP